MSVQCHYKYNNELHHFRMGEYRKTDDDKQACIIEFVLFSILLTYNIIQHLLSALYTNKHALMRYLIITYELKALVYATRILGNVAFL